MKDEILFYGEQINIKCVVCKKFRHSIEDCPYLHLKMNKSNVIYKHLRNMP